MPRDMSTCVYVASDFFRLTAPPGALSPYLTVYVYDVYPFPVERIVLEYPPRPLHTGLCQWALENDQGSRKRFTLAERRSGSVRCDKLSRMRGVIMITCLICCRNAPAANPCIGCHPAQTKGYTTTGMANSLSRVATQPPGEFRHVASGSQFSVVNAGHGMRQSIERGGVSGEYPVAYVVGSGHRAFGYLVQIGDYLFQSPIAYQTQEQAWIMAPGYENNLTPDFNRPVGYECLLCHSGQPKLIKGTRNRYENLATAVEGISCERCHGPAAQHLAKPSRNNIVNPRRLEPNARDSVCEQCHLQGEARILNPGKDWDDFVPGQTLETTFTVFIGDSGDHTPLKVISQSQQLRRSKCWRMSGNGLWCGTCHDPHSEPSDKPAYYREKCLGCHATTRAHDHQSPDRDCIGCHMPSRGTIDGAHAAFTDHQISLRPMKEELARQPSVLVPWRLAPRDYATRNLGLAYLTAGAQHQSYELLGKAFPLIAEARQTFPQDGELTAGLGLYAYVKGMYRKAAEVFELAMQMRPADLTSYQAAAAAWMDAGNTGKALQDLETAIRADPADESTYIMLAEIYAKQNNARELDRVLDLYLKFRPQSIEFQRLKREQTLKPSTP